MISKRRGKRGSLKEANNWALLPILRQPDGHLIPLYKCEVTPPEEKTVSQVGYESIFSFNINANNSVSKV